MVSAKRSNKFEGAARRLALATMVLSALSCTDEAAKPELARRMAALQTSVVQNPARGELGRPSEAPDATAPSTILAGVVAGLDAMLETGAPPLASATRANVSRARAAVVRALAQFGTSPRPVVVLDSLEAAASYLTAAGLHAPTQVRATLLRLSGELAGSARSIAARFTSLAASAGVPEAIVRDANVLLARGGAAIAAGDFVLAISHFGGATSLTTNAMTFDIALFAEKVRDALDGETIGHAYVIAAGGQLYAAGAEGDARTAADPTQADQSQFKEMYTASMSKTLTAVALLKALDAAGVSVDASISPYLPAGWTQHPSVAAVTFRHLLTHRSGFSDVLTDTLGGQSLASLQSVIVNGTPGTLTFNSANYTNSNFGLMRILIPLLTKDATELADAFDAFDEDFVYALFYGEYVSAEVLTPGGIDAGPLCSPDEAASERTLGYLFTSPAASGVDFGDWSLGCGATGWYVSAFEYASFMAFLRYTDDIVNFDLRAAMDAGYLGWLNPVKFSGAVAGAFGDYRAHGGDSVNGNFPGMAGCAMKFPTTVEATVLVNSRGSSLGTATSICALLKDSYDEAWTAP